MNGQIVIYWAASCFTQAERYWNRCCAEFLASLHDYKVILPQDEANGFVKCDKMNFKRLADSCKHYAITCHVEVAILDGPDPDSGMSMECGLRIGANGGLVIGVRTDFRVAEDGQLNAMFRLLDGVIYYPAFSESYEELCRLIDKTIQTMLQEVEFYDPHPGLGGAVVPLPESLKYVANELNGKKMPVFQAIRHIKDAIPDDVLDSKVEADGDSCFISVELEYNEICHGWRLISFKKDD